MAEDDDQKSQESRARHRRQQAQEQGHVAHSPDLTSAGLLLAGLATLAFTGGALVQFLARLLSGHLSGQSWLELPGSAGRALGPLAPGELVAGDFSALVGELGKALLPVLGFMLTATVVLELVQKGPRFRPERVAPDIAPMDPLAGLRRLASASGAARLRSAS